MIVLPDWTNSVGADLVFSLSKGVMEGSSHVDVGLSGEGDVDVIPTDDGQVRLALKVEGDWTARLSGVLSTEESRKIGHELLSHSGDC